MNDNQSPLQSMRERMEALMGKIVKMEQEQQAFLDSVKSVVDDGQKVEYSVDNLSQRVHEVTGAYTTCMSQVKRQINALNEACSNCMTNLLMEGKNVTSGTTLFVDEAKKLLAESEANSSYDKSGFRLSTTILPGDGTMLEVNTDIPQAENMPKRQVSFTEEEKAPEQPSAEPEPEPKSDPADINDGLDALAAFIDPSLKTTAESEPEAEVEEPVAEAEAPTESESEPVEEPVAEAEQESEPETEQEAEAPAENAESAESAESEPESEAAAETPAEESSEAAEPEEEESVPHYRYWEREKKEEAAFPASKTSDGETKEEDKKEEKPWYAQKEEPEAPLGRPQVQTIRQTVTPIDKTPKVSVATAAPSADRSAATQKVAKNRSFFARILGK